MYYEDNTTPSTLHTDISPLTQNLWTSTDIPTSEPTISPTQTLFAVVGFDCAASLPYGPQSITQAGSADTQYPYYVSTNTENKAVRHRNGCKSSPLMAPLSCSASTGPFPLPRP